MKFDGKVKDFMMDLPYDVAGSILYALGVYTFAKSSNFAPGGISGRKGENKRDRGKIRGLFLSSGPTLRPALSGPSGNYSADWSAAGCSAAGISACGIVAGVSDSITRS